MGLAPRLGLCIALADLAEVPAHTNSASAAILTL